MNSFSHTWSGKEINAGISGFSSITTNHAEVPDTPAPVLSLEDILVTLKKFKDFTSLPKLTKAVAQLEKHVANKNNPHNLTLDQFADDIADALYKEFIRQGGVATKEQYVTALFQTLRIATLEELAKADKNSNLLLSVRGVNALITEHNLDKNAHKTIIDEFLPGEAFSAEPSYVFHSYVGDLPRFTYIGGEDEDYKSILEKNIKDEYYRTRVNEEGYIETYNAGAGVKADYELGEPLMPVFGKRTNLIKNSNIFTNYSVDNILALNTSVVGPDQGTKTTVVRCKATSTPVEHNLYIDNIEVYSLQPKTFSIYAKMAKCPYLAIRFTDLAEINTEVWAAYDLTTGECVIGNHLNRYHAEMHALTDGWYRCTFTIYREQEEASDLKITWFKDNFNDPENSFVFASEVEDLGYLFGAQLEDGLGASPYIPTEGESKSSQPVKVIMDLNKITTSNSTLVLDVIGINPRPQVIGKLRPLLTAYDEHDRVILRELQEEDGSTSIIAYRPTTIGNQNVNIIELYATFTGETKTHKHLALASSNKGTYTQLNKIKGLGIDDVLPKSSMSKIYLGCDKDENFLEGYIRSLTVYGEGATQAQLKFLVGEVDYE